MSAHTPGSSIAGNFDALKQMAMEFFVVMPTLNRDELENGFKAFGLGILGCEHASGLRGDVERDVEAPALYRIMERAYTQRQIDLDAEEHRAATAKATGGQS